MLRGNKVFLRALEQEDVAPILAWENDPENWRVSGTKVPFSKQAIVAYIAASQDIFTVRQVRLMICRLEDNKAIGTVDLFNYDPVHQHAGVGILIDKAFRKKGYGLETLQLTADYALNGIGIRNLECTILSNNENSKRLFEAAGYEKVGCKKKWFNNFGEWLDEYSYQKELIK